MPELPEVHTTTTGINKEVVGLKITDVWTNYNSSFHAGKNNIKNPSFFVSFKKEVAGKKITSASRRGKNVLIHLENNKTILVHMKMTGHIMCGKYKLTKDTKDPWKATEPGPLRDDSFNKWIHFVCVLSNKKHLVLSDMRKFAKVTLFETHEKSAHFDLKNLGPEPLSELTPLLLATQLSKKPRGLIKTVLLAQSIVAGVGNIYSDEILWLAGMHPERKVKDISPAEIKKIFSAMIDVLETGIELGGDSMSDYRNIHGLRGGFQNSHKAYRRTKQKCLKKGCSGIILRKVIGGRSAHFCDVHQK